METVGGESIVNDLIFSFLTKTGARHVKHQKFKPQVTREITLETLWKERSEENLTGRL